MGDTLVSLVRDRAEQTPESMAFAILQGVGQELAELTCAGLEREARRVATLVAARVAPGGRALLVYEPGLDFLGAFFGCLFAGVTAIPVYPPFPNQLEAGLARLDRTLHDAGAHAVLASEALMGLSQMMRSENPVPWIVTSIPEEGEPEAWRDPGTAASAVAVMQYTSGSTTDPRGVVLRHENVIANLQSIDWFLGGATHGASVSWLPTYHDMGLVGGVIYNLSRGRPTYLLSPLHFLKHPASWLDLVSRVRATVSTGPPGPATRTIRPSARPQ